MILEKLIQGIKKNWALLSIACLLIFTLVYHSRWNAINKDDQPIFYDVLSYYEYLPAVFIHGDLSFKFLESGKVDSSVVPLYWTKQLGNGKKLIKTTMGWAYLNIPAFFVGHLAAKLLGYNPDGFSKPYQVAVAFNVVLFVIIGLYSLLEILQVYFSARVSVISLFVITFGTNLFHYTVCANPVTHGYNFTLITLFLFVTIQWFASFRVKYLYCMVLLFCLILLIRPTNFIIAVIPLLFAVHRANFIRTQFDWIRKYKLHILLAGILGFLVVFPQLLYWKIQTGSWIFNSYVGERFIWDRPMVYEFLFSFRKGWFLYTPMMLFALIGFVMKKEQLNNLLPQIFILLVVVVWMNSCWWCWWFGGSFGARTMVDFYGLFALPLAIFIEYTVSKHYMLKICTFTVFLFLIYVNIFQSYQVLTSLIHWDGMTKAAYWEVFLKNTYPQNYEKLLNYPDYEAALEGKVVR